MEDSNMSDSSSDAMEISNGWILLPGNKDDDTGVETLTSSNEENLAARSEGSSSDNLPANAKNMDKDPSYEDEESASHASSDVDVIDEEAVSCDDNLTTSVASSYSFMDNNYGSGEIENLTNEADDILHEDLSENSVAKDELPANIRFEPAVKQYIHTRNYRLNILLNLLLALSITAVISLGVGHFLGWSSHSKHYYKVTSNQVQQLKQLQDELVLCMQKQSAYQYQTETEEVGNPLQVCYMDSDHWRNKFLKLFSENKGMKEFLEDTQQNLLKENMEFNKEACPMESREEFEKLQFHFLIKQMEHLNLLKSFEEVKNQELLSRKKLKILLEENSELKLKLEEESEDDKEQLLLEVQVEILRRENGNLRKRLQEEERENEVVESLEDQISHLKSENLKLKNLLSEKENVDSSSDLANLKSPIHLKQQINDLITENEDLKTLLARIKYTKPLNSESDKSEEPQKMMSLLLNEVQKLQDKIADLSSKEEEKSNLLLKAQESAKEGVNNLKDRLDSLQKTLEAETTERKKWKELYDILIEDVNKKNQSDNTTIGDWILSIANTTLGGLNDSKDTVANISSTVFQYINETNISLSNEFSKHINTTQQLFSNLQDKVTQKWSELRNFTNSDKFNSYYSRTKKTTEKMSRMLNNVVTKVQDAGYNFLNPKKPVKKRFERLVGKVSNLLSGLDHKWNVITKKFWKKEEPENLETKYKDLIQEGISKGVVTFPSAAPNEPMKPERIGDVSPGEDGSWYFKQKNARDKMHQKNILEDKSSQWYFDRAKERENRHRDNFPGQSQLYEDWTVRRAKGRTNLRKSASEYENLGIDEEDDEDDYDEPQGPTKKDCKNKKKYHKMKKVNDYKIVDYLTESYDESSDYESDDERKVEKRKKYYRLDSTIIT